MFVDVRSYTYGRKSSQPPEFVHGFVVEDLLASYFEWLAQAFHRCGLHLEPGTQRLEDPVSKMTEKFCKGVPSYGEERGGRWERKGEEK